MYSTVVAFLFFPHRRSQTFLRLSTCVVGKLGSSQTNWATRGLIKQMHYFWFFAGGWGSFSVHPEEEEAVKHTTTPMDGASKFQIHYLSPSPQLPKSRTVQQLFILSTKLSFFDLKSSTNSHINLQISFSTHKDLVIVIPFFGSSWLVPVLFPWMNRNWNDSCSFNQFPQPEVSILVLRESVQSVTPQDKSPENSTASHLGQQSTRNLNTDFVYYVLLGDVGRSSSLSCQCSSGSNSIHSVYQHHHHLLLLVSPIVALFRFAFPIPSTTPPLLTPPPKQEASSLIVLLVALMWTNSSSVVRRIHCANYTFSSLLPSPTPPPPLPPPPPFVTWSVSLSTYVSGMALISDQRVSLSVIISAKLISKSRCNYPRIDKIIVFLRWTRRDIAERARRSSSSCHSLTRPSSVDHSPFQYLATHPVRYLSPGCVSNQPSASLVVTIWSSAETASSSSPFAITLLQTILSFIIATTKNHN